MKSKLLTVVLIASSLNLLAQQNYYDVNPGTGYGLRLWAESPYQDYFKISMGNTGEYHFGPVTDYSIKTSMNAVAGRGWTWGGTGTTPVAAIAIDGSMQIAGSFKSGNVKIFATDEAWAEGVSIVKASGWAGIRLTRNNPSGGNYSGNWALGYNASTGNDFSISNNYSGTQYDGIFHISSSTRNIGVGTTSPNAPLHVKGSGQGSHLTIETSNGEGDLSWFQGGSATENQRAILQVNQSSGDFEGWVYGSSWQQWLSVNRSNRNVGIGISSPDSKLHVNGKIKIQGNNDLEFGGGITKEVSAGRIAYQLWSDALDIVGAGTTSSNRKIKFYAEGGTSFNGNVGIGTSSPDQLLTVNGTIHGKEVKVDLSIPAPDYVFEKDYNLPSLEEIKIYIDQNKHLPEVPSAKEMEVNGVQLGEMNMILLKKIEELTLYMLEQNKIIQNQNERLTTLENQK